MWPQEKRASQGLGAIRIIRPLLDNASSEGAYEKLLYGPCF